MHCTTSLHSARMPWEMQQLQQLGPAGRLLLEAQQLSEAGGALVAVGEHLLLHLTAGLTMSEASTVELARWWRCSSAGGVVL